jgi:hypothetical protein
MSLADQIAAKKLKKVCFLLFWIFDFLVILSPFFIGRRTSRKRKSSGSCWWWWRRDDGRAGQGAESSFHSQTGQKSRSSRGRSSSQSGSSRSQQWTSQGKCEMR